MISMNHTGNGGFRSAVAAAEAALLLVPLLPPRALVGADRLVVAGHPDQLVALLVDEQLALRALEALPAQAPDPVPAERAEGPLRFEKEREIFCTVAISTFARQGSYAAVLLWLNSGANEQIWISTIKLHMPNVSSNALDNSCLHL